MRCTYVIHRVYKEFQDWSEAKIDCLALSLYHLQIYYINEIKRGMSGSGQYELKEKYEYLKAEHYAFQCVNVGSPENIIKNLRDESILESQKFKEENEGTSTTELIAKSSNNDNEPKCFELGECITEDSDTNPDLESFKEFKKDKIKSLKPTTYLLARACAVLRNQNITYDTNLNAS